MPNYKSKSKSICQYCFNFNCSWHIRFEPVKGWKATPTVIPSVNGQAIKSYEVMQCPRFTSRNGGKVPLEEGRITLRRLGEMLGFCESCVSKMDRKKLSALVRENGFKLIIDRDGIYNQYFIEEIKK